jgi:hypothetical protein
MKMNKTASAVAEPDEDAFDREYNAILRGEVTDLERAADYGPTHPWYYLLGGRILTADEIKPIHNDGAEHFQPPKNRAKAIATLDTLRASLIRDRKSYEILRTAEGRAKHKPMPWETNTPALSWASGISLTHNHILSSKAEIALYEKHLGLAAARSTIPWLARIRARLQD